MKAMWLEILTAFNLVEWTDIAAGLHSGTKKFPRVVLHHLQRNKHMQFAGSLTRTSKDEEGQESATTPKEYGVEQDGNL